MYSVTEYKGAQVGTMQRGIGRKKVCLCAMEMEICNVDKCLY